MVDPAIEQRVLEQFGNLRALLGIPEVGDLLIQAVDPNQPFTQQAFEAKLHATQWWQTTPESQRNAYIQSVTDPATHWQVQNQTGNDLVLWANNLGVAIDQATRSYITGNMINSGEDLNSAGVQLGLRAWLRGHPEAEVPGGRLASAISDVYALARKDYFYPASWDQARHWGIGLVTGEFDEASMRSYFRGLSLQQFPQLADWVLQGMTPAQIIDPLRAVAAEELEVGIEQIDIGRPEWQMLTGMPNTGGRDQGTATVSAWRLPTQSEIREQARRQSQWWETSKGRQTDAGMSRALLEAFGKAAY